MNYRHVFHAGNFADLVKHAALTLLLESARRPLTVIDTHGGAGAYDLTGVEALKTGEAKDGIARLLSDPAAPEAFDALVAAVSRHNPGGRLVVYPGSPALICAALGEHDRLIACEMRPDDHARLESLLAPLAPQALAMRADGYQVAAERTPQNGAVLVLIDPPYERGDDYARTAGACAAVLARNSQATVLVWTPLKDLETFDGFLRRIEAASPPHVLVAEARLRPLTDPMAMNGCALVIFNPPDAIDTPLRDICDWVAAASGAAGAEGRVWWL